MHANLYGARAVEPSMGPLRDLVFMAHGPLLLRVASYGYVPPPTCPMYFILHYAAPIALTPTPTASRLVFPHLIL